MILLKTERKNLSHWAWTGGRGIYLVEVFKLHCHGLDIGMGVVILKVFRRIKLKTPYKLYMYDICMSE